MALDYYDYLLSLVGKDGTNRDIKSISLGRNPKIELYSDNELAAKGLSSFTPRVPEQGAGTPALASGAGGPGTLSLETLQELAKATPTSEAVPSEGGTAWHRVLGALSTPEKVAGLTRLLGSVAKAITATSPRSWQYQLADALSKTAAATQMEALRKGEDLSGLAAFGLTPEERTQIAKEAILGREAANREAYTKGYLDYLNKIAGLQAREETPEERYRRERDITLLRTLLGGSPSRYNPWIKWGYGQMLNIDTGEVKNVPTPPVKETPPPSGVIPEKTREEALKAVFDQIKRALPPESKLKGAGLWTKTGVRGKIDPDDLDRMIIEGKLPPEARKPKVMALIKQYALLRGRADVIERLKRMGVDINVPIEEPAKEPFTF